VRSALREVLKRSAQGLVGKDARRKLELQKLNLEKRIYRKPIHANELREALLALGGWQNRIVYVQSSWNQFYNVKMKSLELIDLMLELVGPNGTLVMPTHPLVVNFTDVFKIDEAPSSSGLLTELFRRKRGAKRSIHISSAVSALGPAADDLTNEHHLDVYSWGPKTPFGKMVAEDALLVLLGTVQMGFTPLHSVECALHGSDPRYDMVFNRLLKYNWLRKDGATGIHEFYVRNGLVDPGRIRRHFDKSIYRQNRLSNLTLQAMDAKRGIDRALELAKSGVTIYPHLERAGHFPSSRSDGTTAR
jgi:aminoglycoside N3'-acetyltransferase